MFLSDTHIGGAPGSDIFESAAELTLLIEDVNRHDGPVELVVAGDFFDMLTELPGSDVDLSWEAPEAALDGIQEFLTGARGGAEPSRVLATVLFTDIVASTERAARLGDRRWRELLEVHDELAGRLVGQFHGQLVKRTGDVGGIAVHIAARVMARPSPGSSSPPGRSTTWSSAPTSPWTTWGHAR